MTDLSIDAWLLAVPTTTARAPMPSSLPSRRRSLLLLARWRSRRHGLWRQGLLLLLGGALGLTLYHALFGFTSAWRGHIVARREAACGAQMVMLGQLAVLLFFQRSPMGTLFSASRSMANMARSGSACSRARSCSDWACSSAAAAPRARSTPREVAIRGCWSRWRHSSSARRSARCICRGGAHSRISARSLIDKLSAGCRRCWRCA